MNCATTTTCIAAALAVTAWLTAPAHAGEEVAVVVDATHLLPRDGVHAGASGPGVELRFFEKNQAFTGGFGAFAAIGAPGTDTRRDVLDVHTSVGVKPKRSDSIAPYIAVGLNVLHVTTHQPMRTLRGTTLGINAQVGLLGRIGEKLFLRANVGYLGAIVPGTGEDLGGWIVQAGLGLVIDD
jgi:hypothetical protein